MAAWRYEISLPVLKKYFTHSLHSIVKYFSTLEEKFHISAQPCNILYISRGRPLSCYPQVSQTKVAFETGTKFLTSCSTLSSIYNVMPASFYTKSLLLKSFTIMFDVKNTDKQRY